MQNWRPPGYWKERKSYFHEMKIMKGRKKEKSMKTALTIAGSDSSGGAGIQADLKTMTAHHVFGMSAITALTAQNTMGVTGIMDVTPEFLREELDAVFTDIFPDAVKVGMVSSSDLIRVIADKLSFYRPKYIVVDPVMVATSGARLISEEAVETLKEELIPIATLITPNLAEAEVLSGMKINSRETMVSAGRKIRETYGTAVLMKGGHFEGEEADDLLLSDEGEKWFHAARIDNPNTHGTGCTLSSAIASNLALGKSLSESVAAAKDYLTGAIMAGLDLGHGRGPLDHAYFIPEAEAGAVNL
jgi:hydroxymethylpyrimidine/phosphomethylpyrimidine kinase